MNERQDKVIEEIVRKIREWMDKRKHGNIQINFSCGGVSNVNLNESIKIESGK